MNVEKYFSFRCTGTVQDKNCSPDISTDSIIEDAADALSDGVQGIFKGLGF